MNCLRAFALSIIIFLLPLSRPSYTISGQQVDVQVHISFSDAREVVLTCLSSKPSGLVDILPTRSVARGKYTSWMFDGQSKMTCNACWRPQTYIAFAKFVFIAFKSSWLHGDSFKNPETGEYRYAWMFNETGLFRFEYPASRYELKILEVRIMEKSTFFQDIAIYVVNGFDDGRVISIFNTENPSTCQSASYGGYGSWIIKKFSMETQRTCRVTWLGLNKHVAQFIFTAFNGTWPIDAKISDPLTEKLRFEWFINNTGLYLFDFVKNSYELMRSLPELNVN